MVAISRRMLLAGAGTLAATAAKNSVEACSLVAKPTIVPFSELMCRRSLAAMVALIGKARDLSDAELGSQLDALSIEFEDGVSNGQSNADLMRSWSLANDTRDRSPIALHELNLIKKAKGTALFQFTLRRDAYYAEVSEVQAANDGCGVSSPEPAYFGPLDASYLGYFVGNKLRRVFAFDVWLQAT